MHKDSFEKVTELFFKIDNESFENKIVLFSEVIDILSVQARFSQEQKFLIYSNLHKHMNIVFPFLGLDSSLLEENDLEVELTNGIWKMIEEYVFPYKTDKVITDSELVSKKLRKIEEIKLRVEDLEAIDELFEGFMYISIEDILLKLPKILDDKYEYEALQYRQRVYG